MPSSASVFRPVLHGAAAGSGPYGDSLDFEAPLGADRAKAVYGRHGEDSARTHNEATQPDYRWLLDADSLIRP